MRYKIFVIIFFLANFIFSSFHFFMWEFKTKKIYDGEYRVGDLGSRIGYVLGSIDFRQDFVDLPKKHFDSFLLTKNQLEEQYDILTVGDSFSNGGAGGRNAFYQDYIASDYNKRILNIQKLQEQTQIETIATLLNSGYLEKIKPKYIIVQGIERDIVGNFGRKQNTTISLPLDKLADHLLNNKPPWKIQTYNFVNSGNYKFLAYVFLRYFNDRAFFSDCYSLKLNKRMFSVDKCDTLLVYYEDIKNNKEKTDGNIYLVNQNLNKLQQMLTTKGIKLIFLIAPDKYNLYYDFLSSKKYENSQLFEKISALKQDYIFINSKDILVDRLKKNEQDLYFADDTHWSYKASEAIVQSMKFMADETRLAE